MPPLASIVDANDDEVLQIPMGTVNILINDNQNPFVFAETGIAFRGFDV